MKFLFALSPLGFLSIYAHAQFPSSTDSVNGSATPQITLTDPRSASDFPNKAKIPVDRAIEANPDETDRQIQARLSRIAHSQDVFKNVKVSVVEGIVTLKGTVEEQADEKSFSALAERVDGVIGVVDRLQVKNVQKTGLRLAESEIDNLIDKFFRSIPYVASCFVIFMLTILAAMLVHKGWRIALGRKLPERVLLASHLAKIFTVPIYVLGFYLILQVGGLTGLAATVVGGTGMLGVILGLAGKNILENYLSSFMLSLRNPFKVGDQVKIGEDSGIVHKVDSRCTMLLTNDGIFTQIPNSIVLNAVIRNYSVHPVNRVTFTVTLDQNHDISAFNRIFAQTILLSGDTISEEPAPEAVVTEISKDSTTIQCSFWVDTNLHHTARVKSGVLQAIQLYLNSGKNMAERQKVLQETLRKDAEAPSEKEILRSRIPSIRPPDPKPESLIH